MIQLQLIASCCLLYVALRLSVFIFKRFIVRSSLDNLPGPPPSSFLKGGVDAAHSPSGSAFLIMVLAIKAFFHSCLASQLGTFIASSLKNVSAITLIRTHPSKLRSYFVDGGVVRVRGPIGKNYLYVFDPLALHHILLKDQASFEFSKANLLSSHLLLGNGLLSTSGDVHRRQRKMLTPVFSAAHMRNMVPLFYNIGHKLEHAFAQRVKSGPEEIDVLSWSSRTALELITQSGFGSTFDPLTEDALPHSYANAVKRLLVVLSKTILWRLYVLPTANKIGTPKFRRAVLELLPSEAIQEARETADLMYETSVKIYETKKQALAQGDDAFKDQIAQGKDLISILMRNNSNALKGDALPEDEIIGQMSTFTFAATDTTSNAISRTLWLLSQRQDVQDELRAELREAMTGKETLDYDEVAGLKYLDAVCRELLRLYPPVPVIAREAGVDTVLPLHTPVQAVDGQVLHEVLVPAGTRVFLSIDNCNRNPTLWGPDAEEFKPERWLSSLPEAVTNARVPGVYSNLMTFGGGGRSCIGFKFSQLEMKVILSLLVRRFKFSLPKDKEIYWNMTGIVSPCVIKKDGPSSPLLPLIVEEAK